MPLASGPAEQSPALHIFPFSTIALLGGTGSLGVVLTRHLLTTYPQVKIRVLSRGEHRQAAMQAQFGPNPRLSYLLGDVRDFQRLRVALTGCDLAINAAAIKRIDLAAYNPYEACATNITGTWNVLQAAMDAAVKQVIIISSDKAVNSATLYGSTKAVCEALAVYGNHYPGLAVRYCALRYGNVGGSQGSLIPIWQGYVADQKPLPITSHAMTRFWISMDDAVRFICFVAAQQSRGGLFIPHLPAFHVTDLARAMLDKASGEALKEGEDVVTIGLRGVEKMHEDLATDDEMQRAYWYAPSEHAPITYCVPPLMPHWHTEPLAPAWQQPPAPCLTGEVAGSPGPAVRYNSGVWPWRLSVQDLRQRLAVLATT